MRPIKFRGVIKGNFVDEDTNGQIVCGSFVVRKYNLFDDYRIVTLEDGFNVEYPVDPESVVQLVGYDRDGNEVYEGDTVIGDTGDKLTVHFHPLAVNDDDCIDMLNSKFSFKLKEAADDATD